MKSLKEKIQDKIEKLEKEKMDYLEVGKMTTVRRKEEEIEILELALDGLKCKETKEKLRRSEQFIKSKGLEQVYKNYKE